MSENKKPVNTTIQVKSEIYEHIKKFCKNRGIKISSKTEEMWATMLSASFSSGSII